MGTPSHTKRNAVANEHKSDQNAPVSVIVGVLVQNIKCFFFVGNVNAIAIGNVAVVVRLQQRSFCVDDWRIWSGDFFLSIVCAKRR